MDDKLNTIENEIKELKKIVLLLTEKIDNINKNIDNNVVTECKKMGEHINFVDGVFLYFTSRTCPFSHCTLVL